MILRFFGGWELPEDLCDDPQMVRTADASGVPMGGVLAERQAGGAAPRFVVHALRDPGTADRPGAQLQRLQIVKGWIAAGERHERVFDVAGDASGTADVDLATCEPRGAGADSLCATWSDPSRSRIIWRSVVSRCAASTRRSRRTWRSTTRLSRAGLAGVVRRVSMGPVHCTRMHPRLSELSRRSNYLTDLVLRASTSRSAVAVWSQTRFCAGDLVLRRSPLSTRSGSVSPKTSAAVWPRLRLGKAP